MLWECAESIPSIKLPLERCRIVGRPDTWQTGQLADSGQSLGLSLSLGLGLSLGFAQKNILLRKKK